jgi:hypothetical protein
VTKNRLVFRKLAKEPSKLSPGRDPVRARTSPGCPRLSGEPRAPSFVVDQGMNSMEVEGEEKRDKRSRLICLYVDWIDGKSIGHDPLIYIEGVVLSW